MEKTQWIPCLERLPEIGTDVLMLLQNGRQRVGKIIEGLGWFQTGNYCYNFLELCPNRPYPPTHWMPLPDMPDAVAE